MILGPQEFSIRINTGFHTGLYDLYDLRAALHHDGRGNDDTENVRRV
jgi:hypothetical protein